MQLKNLCEDCIHPSKLKSCMRAKRAGTRPACAYLLFQLFPRLTLRVWEKVLRMWRWGRSKRDGEIPSSRKEAREEEGAAQKVCLCAVRLSTVPVAKWRVCTVETSAISYNMCSLSVSHTHALTTRGEDEVPRAFAPTRNTPTCLAAPRIDWSSSQTQSH